jgi:FSR family fosmidomycin resistance protein-like MFS transporter
MTPITSDHTKKSAQADTSTKAGDGPVLSESEGFQLGRVVSITSAHLAHDTYASFLAPLLPAFIDKLALSKTEAGLLAFFQSSPSLLQPFIGHLADRVSLRYFVILGPAVTATMMSLLGVAPNYAVLAMFLTVVGFSSAAFHAVAPAMAGRLSGRKLGRGMGLWMLGGSLGFALGPIVIVSAVNFLTLEGTPWLMIGGLLASAFIYIWLRDVPASPPISSQRISFREGLGVMRPLLAPLVGIVAGRALMVAALTIFLPTFLVEEGADLSFAGLSLAVLQAAGWAGALLGGALSDRLGRRLVLFISMLVPSLLMFVFLEINGWVRLPILVAIGMAGLSTRTVLMASVQENYPENRALANGIYLALTFVLESGAAPILGALGDLFGLPAAFTASAVIALLGVPLIFLLPRKQSAHF